MTEIRSRQSQPNIGPWVPAALLNFAFIAVAAGLSLLVLDSFWLPVGVLLAVLAMTFPNRVSPWWVLLLLGLSQIWREPSAKDVTFHLLLAGLHLLHVLASLVMVMPSKGRIQVAALIQPLSRFVFVQVVAQSVAVGALLMFNSAGTIPGVSIIAAAVLGVVAVMLARGLHQLSER